MDSDIHQTLLPSMATSQQSNGWEASNPEGLPLLIHSTLPPATQRPGRLRDPYTSKYLYLGAWIGLLVLEFALTRVLAEQFQLPNDSDQFDRHLLYETLSHFLLFGFVLAWFVDVTEHERSKWLFSWNRWYFFVFFIVTSPAYSYISDLDGLQHSLDDIPDWGAVMWAAAGLLCGIAFIFLIVHLYLAAKRKTMAGFIVYLVARGIVFGFYVVAALYLHNTHYCKIHIHHYFVAWCVALFAEFNHPISAIMLAIATSIFVQGTAVYSCAPIFNNDYCMHSVRPSMAATCLFMGNQNFTLTICPGDGSPPFSEAACFPGDRIATEMAPETHMLELQ